MNDQKTERVTMAHGSGGADSALLMRDVFAKHFGNYILDLLEDSAVVPVGGSLPFIGSATAPSCAPQRPADRPAQLAISTDSFVVTPLVFPGGDIGKLAVCGTVNDVLMSGAKPLYLTCGFIIEAGLPIPLLDTICASLAAAAAAEAGVIIAAGDTKVIEGRSEEGGLIINTTGIGTLSAEAAQVGAATCRQPSLPVIAGAAKQSGGISCPPPSLPVIASIAKQSSGISCLPPSPAGIRPGDAIIVSGNLGDHHAAILSARMGIENNIKSDCALLSPIIHALREAGVYIHAMRDVTRGGLGTVLNELAGASSITIMLEEAHIPVSPEVRALCGILGLDPLYMGNEGKAVLAVAQEDSDLALAAMKGTEIGRNAAVIGAASDTGAGESASVGAATCRPPLAQPPVVMRTRIGGTVRVDVLYGEGLPRIC